MASEPDSPPSAAELADGHEHALALISAPFVAALIDAARIPVGGSVIDLVCATGVATRAAAEAAGPMGRVAGVDTDAGLLDVAADHRAGLVIEWVQADPEALPFPSGTFDRVISQQGLQRIPDLRVAVEEACRVLRVDGGFAGTVWLPLDHNPFFAAEATAIAALAGRDALVGVEELPDRIALVAHELRAGGLVEITTSEVATTVEVPADEHFIAEHLATSFWARDLDQAGRARAARAVLADLAGYRTGSGTMTLPFASAVVHAFP
ncbi:methyltransferase domain-containing protein [Occultella glacieicola]|uniref:Methyltransferase domain-containing protein n=1 Tax=Occultella glacieicola TaxID=2518684 RepID=A0ABY2DWN4_9MICO|nr:methyltransferase domain-containing protein [Occultella glacieicola]TDE88285.1 methyltransferase domain-containing protein [Occultella glacieicola]